MIYDKIENLPLWAEKIPSLGYALTESKKIADSSFALGKTVIDGEALFASSSEYIAEARETKIFENKEEDFTPFYAEGVIAIDGCTVMSGKVNCMQFIFI